MTFWGNAGNAKSPLTTQAGDGVYVPIQSVDKRFLNIFWFSASYSI